MAEKEAWLESYAHSCGIPGTLLSQLTAGRSKEQIIQYFRDAIGRTDADQRFGLFVAACMKVLRQAEALRKQTASQLLMLAQSITSGGLDYYTKKDTHPGSADPDGLFNDGTSPHAAITRQLEKELADDGKRLKDSPADVKEALGSISKIGEYGGKIGGIMGGIEGVQKSKGLFETTKNVGNLAGAVGPVLQTLGLLVFAE